MNHETSGGESGASGSGSPSETSASGDNVPVKVTLPPRVFVDQDSFTGDSGEEARAADFALATLWESLKRLAE